MYQEIYRINKTDDFLNKSTVQKFIRTTESSVVVFFFEDLSPLRSRTLWSSYAWSGLGRSTAASSPAQSGANVFYTILHPGNCIW